ncbi:MAG: hypothetical protein HY925_10750, partial [Elusimicrobia bacterium]|nr:hypothetical protein [Elusimicrobiota bacterium]
MIEARHISVMTRTIARILVAALIITSPGALPYRAFAQTVAGANSSAAVPVSVALPMGGVAAPSVTLPPTAGVSLGVLPVVRPVSTLKAQTVSAAVAVTVQGLAGGAKAENGKLASSGILAQAALPMRAQPTAASEGSVEHTGRAFEGTAKRERSGADASEVSGIAGAEHASGLSAEAALTINGGISIPSVALPSHTAPRWWNTSTARKAGLALGMIGLSIALRESAPAAMAALGMSAPLMFGVLGNDEPEGKNLERFQNELADKFRPGEAISESASRDAARAAGVDVTKNQIAMLRLPEGMAVPLAGGQWLYLGLNFATGVAAAKAMTGLKFYRTAKWQDHLLAVAELEEATRLWETQRKAGVSVPAAALGLHQLKGNAYVKI